MKVKYIVVSKFAHFKVGEVIELDESCPSAAHAHVKRHVATEPRVEVGTVKRPAAKKVEK